MRSLPLRTDGSVQAWALVDDEDWDRVMSVTGWKLDAYGYVVRNLPRGQVVRGSQKLHRFIFGVTEADPEVDHRNGNRLDCRKSNLRLASRAENAQNVASRPGSSRFRGVSFSHRHRLPWRALVIQKGRRIFDQRFATELEAAQAASDFRLANLPYSAEEERFREYLTRL